MERSSDITTKIALIPGLLARKGPVLQADLHLQGSLPQQDRKILVLTVGRPPATHRPLFLGCQLGRTSLF